MSSSVCRGWHGKHIVLPPRFFQQSQAYGLPQPEIVPLHLVVLGGNQENAITGLDLYHEVW